MERAKSAPPAQVTWLHQGDLGPGVYLTRLIHERDFGSIVCVTCVHQSDFGSAA